MHVRTFLEHYQIRENPFRAEEAGQDAVFSRIEDVCRHPDFEKICGDLDRPATSIVFGERGSGKTAIRMQIEQEVDAYNLAHPAERCLLIPYDDLNPVLDRFTRHRGMPGSPKALAEFRLIDHMDAVLGVVVPRIVDQLLGGLRGRKPPLVIEDLTPKRLRHLDTATKRDLMMLQLCYDRPEAAAARTERLKRVLRFRSHNALGERKWAAVVTAVLFLGGLGFFLVTAPTEFRWLWWLLLGLVGLGAVGLTVRYLQLLMRTHRQARDLARHLRVADRPVTSYRAALAALRTEEVQTADLPMSDSDEPRYAMFARLMTAIAPFGYRSLLILVDRVDEPTLVNGEPERMQAIVWPLLNNKFLQQAGVGVKLLLPLELRYLLNREGSEFYREARLDKQNFIDRLSWSGATLYDVCTARLNACREEGAEPISIIELFGDGVTRQDIVDALDQMHQPRDAFKFLYQLVQEHCSNIPDDMPSFKIVRPTLDAVRKQQSERMSAMLRGVQPA